MCSESMGHFVHLRARGVHLGADADGQSKNEATPTSAPEQHSSYVFACLCTMRQHRRANDYAREQFGELDTRA